MFACFSAYFALRNGLKSASRACFHGRRPYRTIDHIINGPRTSLTPIILKENTVFFIHFIGVKQLLGIEFSIYSLQKTYYIHIIIIYIFSISLRIVDIFGLALVHKASATQEERPAEQDEV